MKVTTFLGNYTEKGAPTDFNEVEIRCWGHDSEQVLRCSGCFCDIRKNRFDAILCETFLYNRTD